MKLTFNINYDTVFGEEVLLNIVETDSKGAKKTSQFRMNNRDGKHWWYELNRKEATLNTSLDYYYFAFHSPFGLRQDGAPHRACTAASHIRTACCSR